MQARKVRKWAAMRLMVVGCDEVGGRRPLVDGCRLLFGLMGVGECRCAGSAIKKERPCGVRCAAEGDFVLCCNNNVDAGRWLSSGWLSSREV